jgi:predicted nucleic acid-binding protein
MIRAYVDSNVILRFLTGDPPEMAARARALFESVDKGEVALVVDEIVIAEVVWVLDSFYHHPAADISHILQELLSHEGLQAADKPGLVAALALYAERNVDLADALVSVHMDRDGIGDVYTFDRHFDRIPGVVRREV